MKGLVGLLLGACCAIVIACASASKTAVAPVQQTAGHEPPMMPGSSPQDEEIDELAQEIDAQRIELGIAVPQPTPFTCSGATCAQTAHAMAAGVTTAPTCKPTTDTCTQSCTLSDSICSNAKKICEIASQLDGDQWAAKKCSDGNETCKAAQKRCCDCR